MLRLIRSLSTSELQLFSNYLATNRSFKPSLEALKRLQTINEKFANNDQEFLDQILKDPELSGFIFSNMLKEVLGDLVKNTTDNSKVLESIIAVSEYEPASNVKTPTIVLSKWRDSVEGGHNLDSTVTKIIVDSSQAKGTVRINRLLNSPVKLHIHPDDAVNSESLARLYSRNEVQFKGKTQFKIPATSKTSPRSINQAIDTNRVDNIPGLSLRSEVPDIAINNVGFQTEPVSLTKEGIRQMADLATERNLDLYVEQVSDGFVIYRGHPPGYIYAKSPTALVEIMKSSGSVWMQKSGRIYFQNFPEGSIQGIMQSLTVRNDGGLLPLTLRRTFFSKNNDFRRWNFDLIPQKDGKFEVLKVSQKDKSVPEKNLLSKISLSEKPNWSKATITRVENPPKPIVSLNKPGLFGRSYQVTLPISNKKPIDLLVSNPQR